MGDIHDLDRYQDVLGQLPMLQAYSHIVYFFPMPKDVSREQIIHDLSDGVNRVRKAVPWMGARIVNVGKGPGNSGIYLPKACALPDPPIDAKYLEDDVPEYAEFEKHRAPVSMIDTKALTPVSGFPHVYEDSDEHPAHAIRLQASFIKGGVLVDFAIMHVVADAGGFYGFVNMVAMSLRGESIPESLLEVANMDRRKLVPLLEAHEAPLDHSRNKRPPLTAAAPLVPSEPARYHVLRFTVENMNKIKELANQPEHFDPSVKFISTDDALCAFCWKHFIKVRLGRYPPETQSKFGRQIDGRRLVGLPSNYMGAMTFNTTSSMTFAQLGELPLAAIASQLRKTLNEGNNVYNLRSFVSFLANEPDKSTVTYAGKFDSGTDVGSSSVRGHPGVFPSFGYLGKPDFIRRPPSIPFASTVVMWPGNPEGDCDAIACLTDKDFEAMSADPEWSAYVDHIG
ncbi:trichothecene 3-O-acetyltransferase [Seiridium cupressi]